MILNRSIKVSLVKPDPEEETDSTNVADMAYILHATGQSLVKGAGAFMLSYMAADTLRQVVVHTAKVKIK